MLQLWNNEIVRTLPPAYRRERERGGFTARWCELTPTSRANLLPLFRRVNQLTSYQSTLRPPFSLAAAPLDSTPPLSRTRHPSTGEIFAPCFGVVQPSRPVHPHPPMREKDLEDQGAKLGEEVWNFIETLSKSFSRRFERFERTAIILLIDIFNLEFNNEFIAYSKARRLSVIERRSAGEYYHQVDVSSLAKSVTEAKGQIKEEGETVMASSGVVPAIIQQAQSAHITEITSPIRRTPPFPPWIYLSRMFHIAPWPPITKLFIVCTTFLKISIFLSSSPAHNEAIRFRRGNSFLPLPRNSFEPSRAEWYIRARGAVRNRTPKIRLPEGVQFYG